MKKDKLVYIASPYAGDVEKNVEFAKQACRFAMGHGCTPVAAHLMYPQFLNDADPKEREAGMRMGLRILAECDELWMCGDEASPGMREEKAAAMEMGIPVRNLPKDVIFTGKAYGIWAVRSQASIFGAAQDWCKQDGEVMAFADFQEAADVADGYNRCATENVRYYPREMVLSPGFVAYEQRM